MKPKSLLFAALLISAGASAQITIQGSALNGWMPADTITDLSNMNAAAIPNGNWDLTTATYGTGMFPTTDQAATHPSFPSATYSTDMSYGLNAFLGYQTRTYWGKDNSGVYIYGEQINRQAYSISAVTMDPQDSLIFPEQTVTYSTPEKVLVFPLSNGDNFSSTMHHTTGFELTVTMYGLMNTPGERRSTLEKRDTVKGWGKMRVKDVNGQPSAYMDVLAVQEREYVVDSFYLGGAPAPDALLTAFGLSQGHVTTRFSTKFFRAGEVNPLLRIIHTDSTFTGIDAAIAMLSRLEYPVTGIGGVSALASFRLYPNPVADGALHVEGITPGSNWTYKLISVNGQAFSGGTLQAENATVNVTGAAAGIYTLTLFRDGVSQGGQFVIIR